MTNFNLTGVQHANRSHRRAYSGCPPSAVRERSPPDSAAVEMRWLSRPEARAVLGQ
jgi:hypothetical protein